MMSEQPTDRTAGTEAEAVKPEARDGQYGHLTVEDDPEGTTDEAELLSWRNRSDIRHTGTGSRRSRRSRRPPGTTAPPVRGRLPARRH